MINSLWKLLHAAQNFLFWHVQFHHSLVEKSGTSMSKFHMLCATRAKQTCLNIHIRCKRAKNRCLNFHIGCKRATHVWISYWVQKSKTCDLNFHIGCKTSFTEELVHRPCWFCFRRSEKSRLFSGSPMYGMCVPSCHNECSTSVGLHSTACFSLL